MYDAAIRNEKRVYLDTVRGIRVAHHADAKGYKEFVKNEMKTFKQQGTGGNLKQEEKRFSSVNKLRSILSGK